MPIAIVRGLASDWLVLGIGVSPSLQEVPETRMFPFGSIRVGTH